MIRDLNSIVEILRDFLANKSDGRIYDRDIAQALGISQNNFAAMKVREKIPYEEIINFSEDTNLKLDNIFLSIPTDIPVLTAPIDNRYIMRDASMIPMLEQGDELVYDVLKTDYTNGGVFIIRAHDQIQVRYIQPKLNGTIDLIPKNTLYSSENTLLTHIEIMGQVIEVKRLLV